MRACEAACVAFAVWTLCSHAVVALGGTLRPLVALYACAMLAGAAAVRAIRRRGGLLREPLPEAAPSVPPPRSRAVLQGALGGGGAAAVALAWFVGGPVVLWGTWCAVLGAAALVFVVREPPQLGPAQEGRGLEAALWVTAALCAVYALVAHRVDADDAFYVNVAVAAVDRPDLPLLAVDTLHGREDLPIHFAAYRLHSYELWNAAVSWLTGIRAIAVFHFVAAAVVSAAIPLCHAVLLRLLSPRAWLPATLALVFVLAVPGETHRWFGNFAFVRAWQGKAVFLFVFMPLVYAFAIRFARQPSGRHWGMLAAAQIAAVGASSSAVWAAPVGAGVALLCALPPSLAGAKRGLVGLLGSVYVLAAGLVVKGDMTSKAPTLARAFPPGDQLADALVRTLGSGTLQLVAVVAVGAAWATRRRGLAQRFAIVVPLVVAVVLLDPYTDAFVRANVTGPSYWRAAWALPVPLLLALVLAAPLAWAPRTRRGLAVAAAASGALALAFALFVPRTYGFGEANHVRLGWPALKVPPQTYRWAALVNERVPGLRVVAPPAIDTWIPTFHHHAYPLMVRTYLRPLRARVGEVAYRDRLVMTHYVAGEVLHEQAPAIFARGLDLYDVAAVVLQESPHTLLQRQILREKGFHRTVQGVHYELWQREPPRLGAPDAPR